MIKKILLIEASEAISKSIILNLQENGYDVSYAVTVNVGLKILSESEVELIIADINLNRTVCMDFVRNISSDKRYSEIPLIMLSDEAGKVSDSRIPGVKGWIIKPFSADKLLQAVRGLSI